jgi:hypothetical protein|tara:strand:- start:927 stop:1751 length:825 start_codon:yes stop_codon:yes gene_type:complete
MWFDILKLHPSGDYGEDPRLRDKIDEGMANTKQPESTGKTAIIFMPHYLKSLKKNQKSKQVINTAIENTLKNLVSGSDKYFWFYLNSNVEDFSFGMFEIIRDNKTKLPRTNIRLKQLLDEDGKPYKSAILFTHSNAGKYKKGGRKGQYQYPSNAKKININFNGVKKGHKENKKGLVRKDFTPLKEMEEWIQVFINSVYEMQRKLDGPPSKAKNWFDITNIMQMVSYKGKGAEHKDIMKLFREVVEIIETKYKNGKELKKELEEIIERRKGELYQ